jgi:CRP-like cAMP-binding protein
VKEKSINPEEIVFRQCEASDKLFFVLKGTVRRIIFKENGDEMTTVGETQQGEMLGETGFFSDRARQESALTVNVAALAYI